MNRIYTFNPYQLMLAVIAVGAIGFGSYSFFFREEQPKIAEAEVVKYQDYSEIIMKAESIERKVDRLLATPTAEPATTPTPSPKE